MTVSRRGVLSGLAVVGLAGGVGQLTAAGTASAAAAGSEFDVTAYGAVGDGAVDNTVAIQTAIDAAAAAGGGVVSFPAGVYKVSIGAGGHGLLLRANVTLRGAGPYATTIRLASGQGEYVAIFTDIGGNSGGTLIEELCIDQNNTDNQITGTRALMSGKARFCVYVTKANAGVTIRRVRFADMDNVNTISANNAVGDLVVTECVFEYGSSPIDHDHSTIYHHPVTSKSCWVTNNVFASRGSGSRSARTAIETHGSSQFITGNRISNYKIGMNLTGVGHTTGEGVFCESNSILDVAIGIQFWSMPYAGGVVASPAIKNVSVRHNVITIDTAGWAPLFVAGQSVSGIRLGAATSGIENAAVDDNLITFRNGTYTGSAKTDSSANGIDWYRPALDPAIVDSKVSISNNVIESPLTAGIRVSCHGRYFKVVGNTVLNVGRGTAAAGGTVVNGYAAGISMTGVFTDTRVNDNHIIDDQSNRTMDIALWLYPLAAGGARNEAVGNHVVGYRTRPIQTHPQNGGWSVRMSADSFVNPGGRLRVGSEITVWSTGRVHRQNAAPEGASWS